MSAYTIPETINVQTLYEAGFERGKHMGEGALEESLPAVFEEFRLELEKREEALTGKAGKPSFEAFKGALDAAESMMGTGLFGYLEEEANNNDEHNRDSKPFKEVERAINQAVDESFHATGEDAGPGIWGAYDKGVQGGAYSTVYRFTNGDPDQGDPPFEATPEAIKAVGEFLTTIARVVDDRGLGDQEIGRAHV